MRMCGCMRVFLFIFLNFTIQKKKKNKRKQRKGRESKSMNGTRELNVNINEVIHSKRFCLHKINILGVLILRIRIGELKRLVFQNVPLMFYRRNFFKRSVQGSRGQDN